MREKLQRAQELMQGNTILFKEVIDEYREKRSEVNRNTELSASGKEKALQRLSKEYEKKSMKIAKQLKQERNDLASDAKKEAEKILTSQLPDVNEQKRKIFSQRVDNLEARVLFATTPDNAIVALGELAKAAEEPTLAYELKPKVMQLSQSILGTITDSNEAISTRKELGQMYEELSEKAKPEGSQEANDTIEAANSIMSAGLVGEAVRNALREVSVMTSSMIDQPQEYFGKYDLQTNE
ncbi:hypothetical protein [Halobacillus kuroshimensis]|uniref:hypothetical protein n=1 Tax=Halobacillus kuroshimensis TaxID=302481 RepID=UPI00040D0683|nr:hypothetical protein [Halobacillus kuroshimensis]